MGIPVALHNLLLVLAISMVGACAPTKPKPEPPSQPVAIQEPVTLNLPEPNAEQICDCGEPSLAVDEENYFDRGVRALAARDYAQARRYFNLHRKSGMDGAARESDVGIAFVAVMSEAAKASTDNGAAGIDERAEVMVLALAAVKTLEGRINALNALNRALSQDLEKREDALKRLRDLTLGQQEGGR